MYYPYYSFRQDAELIICVKAIQDPSHSDKHELIEPLANFDWAQTDPITYRPFRNKQHVAMGSLYLCLHGANAYTLLQVSKRWQKRIGFALTKVILNG